MMTPLAYRLSEQRHIRKKINGLATRIEINRSILIHCRETCREIRPSMFTLFIFGNIFAHHRF